MVVSPNPGRFAPNPVRPLDVSPQRRFAPGRFAPGRFAPLVVSPLVDLPQEEKLTCFVEIYVNSKCKYICHAYVVQQLNIFNTWMDKDYVHVFFRILIAYAIIPKVISTILLLMTKMFSDIFSLAI